MPLLFGIPFLAETLFGGALIWGATSAIGSAADSAQKGAEAGGKFMREVVIPGALIYGAFIYFKSRQKP
jgi:hypothetical protein